MNNTARWGLMVVVALSSTLLQARGFEGEVAVESRSFLEEGLQLQSQSVVSGRFEPSYSYAWNRGDDQINIKLFGRIDNQDGERNHSDIREFNYLHVGNGWEVLVGYGKVFWGVTEFVHLVDIVNQTDSVENIDGEDKLGQPMIRFSYESPFGVFDLFALPTFRERTFPGVDGRLRSPIPVDPDAAFYESGAEEFRTDFAVRWSHFIGAFDISVSHFSGTSRDPIFIPNVVPPGTDVAALLGSIDLATFLSTTDLDALRLNPFHPVIDQTGVTAQYTYGSWLFKFEGFTRGGFTVPDDILAVNGTFEDRFSAATGGFEYTIVGVLGTRSDLGLVAEYLFDDRGDAAPIGVFEHDIALGTRFTLNDAASTTALVGLIYDNQTEEKIFSIEASRRFGSSFTLTLEGRIFTDGESLPRGDTAALLLELATPDPDNKAASFLTEDFIQVELAYFF